MYLISQIVICSFSMILSLVLIILIGLNGKKTDLRIITIIYIASIFIWSSSTIFMVLYYDNSDWIYSHGFYYLIKPIDFYRYLSISSQSAVWFLFCLSYSRKTLTIIEEKLYKHKWLIFIPGFILYIFLIKNENHGLVYYWVNQNGTWLYCFGLLTKYHTFKDLLFYSWGVIVLTRHIRNSYPYYQKQLLIIACSAFISHVTCDAYFYSSFFHTNNNFDIVPLLTLINLSAFNFTIFKYRFLNITPVAFPKMADELKECILIVDAVGIISYYNRSFKDSFCDQCFISIDNDISYFTEYLRHNMKLNDKTEQTLSAIESLKPVKINAEIYLNVSQKYFTVSTQPIYIKKDYIGQIITFYEITDYKKLLEEVENKNAELNLANNQLRIQADAIGELAILKERNRLAGDVHDSVGHTMTILISLIGVCSIAYEKDKEIVKQKLAEMMDIALKGHQELKRSVQGIVQENQSNCGIVQSINSLIRDFKKTGVIVDFSVSGHESSEFLLYTNTIYRVCQEALTNSLKHGKASYVSILLRFSEKSIFLYIIDDGIGCKCIKKNMGLSNMEKRVLGLGGKINFGSDGEQGFNINIEFPVQSSLQTRQIN